MIKKLLTLVCLTIALGASAQTAGFGLKGGLNIANLKATVSGSGLSGSATSDNITALTVGAFWTAPTSSQVTAQVEALYSQQGGGGNGGDFKMNYLLIPVMLRYYASENISLDAGGQLGIMMSATVAGIDAMEQMNQVDFGLGFGLTGEFESGVSLGFRYVLGLSNTIKLDPATTGGISITMTNQVMQFTLGYRLKKKG